MRVTTAIPLRARPYGQGAGDLDVAFAGGRAESVTALLDCCVLDTHGQAYGAEAIWDWTLGERLQALLAVRLAAGEPTLEVQANCAACAETMEIALDLRAFTGATPPAQFRWQAGNGDALELRLPRGHDLRRWQQTGLPAGRELIATLTTTTGTAACDDDTLTAIERAFEEQDPLSALHLQAACPACGHDNDIDCDLEALLLSGFARTQARLIDEVAQLAGAFHWSEAQILALPPWRRTEYLRRLDAGAWL